MQDRTALRAVPVSPLPGDLWPVFPPGSRQELGAAGAGAVGRWGRQQEQREAPATAQTATAQTATALRRQHQLRLSRKATVTQLLEKNTQKTLKLAEQGLPLPAAPSLRDAKGPKMLDEAHAAPERENGEEGCRSESKTTCTKLFNGVLPGERSPKYFTLLGAKHRAGEGGHGTETFPD